MLKRQRWILIVLFSILAHVTVAEEVVVSAAASLNNVLKEIGTNFQTESGVKVIFNFGASSTLARQIEEGAPADIFFSADEAQMDRLAEKDLIDPASRKSCIGNLLVVVIPIESVLEVKSAGDLTNSVITRIAFADPKAVPAGVYGKEWLARQRLWPEIEPKVVPTENVRAALAAVESGNVEAGVVYKTDAGISKKVKIAYEVPAQDAPRITYPMALLKESEQAGPAKRFLDYLSSEKAGRVFKRFGFLWLK